jgi:hypothetical protein
VATFVAVFDACVLHPAPLRDLLLRVAPGDVCGAVREQRAALKNPPRSVAELLDTFLALGLASTVTSLRSMQNLL